MAYSTRYPMNSSPDKTGQGHLYSTLCLAKTSSHPAARLSDVDNPDSSDVETSYSSSPSPLPTNTFDETSPTARLDYRDSPNSARDGDTPATAVEAFVLDQKLMDGANGDNWQRFVGSEAGDESLDDYAVEAVEVHGTCRDEGVYSASGVSLDLLAVSRFGAGTEEPADHSPYSDDGCSGADEDEQTSLELHVLYHSDDEAQSSAASLSPAPRSHAALAYHGPYTDDERSGEDEDDQTSLELHGLYHWDDDTEFSVASLSPAPQGFSAAAPALELSPLPCFAHLEDLQTAGAAVPGGEHSEFHEDEETDSDVDSLGSLSPLTVISSPASFLEDEEHDASSPVLQECEEVRPEEDCLLSPLPSLGYLADIWSPERTSLKDTKPARDVDIFLLWSASRCACRDEWSCDHLARK